MESTGVNKMAFSEKNLRAGLDTFTKPARPRYEEALKNYQSAKKKTTPLLAIEAALTLAVKGLTNKEDKLKVAREAAGVTLAQRSQLPTQSIPTRSFATKVREMAEKRAVAKLSSTSPKARKGPIIGWTLAGGIPVGLAITFLLQSVLSNISGGDGSFPWVPFLVYPFVIPFFVIFGYRKATSPKSTDDSEEGPYAASTAHHSA